jgi:putative hydrolase of HD superfamily
MRGLEEIFQFITELDRLKLITRQNSPVGIVRRENSAEHSWHVAVLALTLLEESKVEIDISRVVKMLLLHDIVEIDAGDTILYNEEVRHEKEAEELAAAKRIFGILPERIGTEFLEIWIEFEERKTNEAIYAYSMDRLMPVIQNFTNRPTTWREHGVSMEQVLRLNRPIGDGVPDVWRVVEQKIMDIFDEESLS